MKTEPMIRQIEIKDSRGRVVGTEEVVTYQGLLSKTHEEGLKAIRTSLVQVPTDDNGRSAIAKAAVETEKAQFEALGFRARNQPGCACSMPSQSQCSKGTQLRHRHLSRLISARCKLCP
jgi:hypothetical protein